MTEFIEHSILIGMNIEQQKAETETGLDILESRIDELIMIINKLREENRSLQSRQERLITERADLIDKTDMARTRVESMITRLKSMETNL